MACVSNCGCCCDCSSTGCPVNLDFGCVFYHKNNTEITQLDGLGLSNGATLELFAESVDEKVKQLNAAGFSLPVLRATYTINTIQQLAQAIDTELGLIKDDVATSAQGAQVAFSATDSATLDFTTSGTLNHTLTGSVKLSAAAGNTLTAQVDGLHVAAQVLSVDYDTKKVSISNGNSVDLTPLSTGISGFLGHFAADPAAVNGQYWFNTTTNKLKIKVNNLVKEIVTA